MHPTVHWLLTGLAVGLLARFLVPGRDPLGLIRTALLGICGAFVGGAGATYYGIEAQGSAMSFVVATAGAMALAIAHRILFGRRG